MIHVPLSRLLIAFTVEFDNAFEQRMPHRTARGPAAHSGRGPWLISQPFWANFLQYVSGPAPLASLPGDLVNVPGLVRWGYLTVTGDTVDLTAAGSRAATLLAPLAAEIEERWVARYGDRVAALRDALSANLAAHLAAHLAALPAHLPMAAPNRPDRSSWPAGAGYRADDDLSVLLARTLLLVTTDVAASARVPMGLGANTLRVLTADGVRTRDLPVLTGTAKEAVAVSLSALQRAGAVTLESTVACLTPVGVRAQKHFQRVTRSSAEAEDLSAAAQAILADTGGLVAGLTPHPGGWRAHPPYVSLTKALLTDPANRLAQYPMVSHRGGYPDGS